jgi:hypothetical protein
MRRTCIPNAGEEQVTTLKDSRGQEPEGAEDGALTAVASPKARWRATLTRSPGLIRRHWLFSTVLAVATLPRLLAMLGYQPAILFRMDTFDYLWGALHPSPNLINPSGYSVFLWLLRPFHSLVLVVLLQHLMGLGIGVMVYAVLRRYGLPVWGATLAAVPVLFDPGQILLEQFIMADLLAMALMMAAFTVLLLAERASLWWLVTAGLLMGASVTVRPTTLPLILLLPAYLLIRRAGWRRAGAVLAAGALPVVAYMGWFDAAHGSFNMTNSNGLFLWSRTMSFANCSVIKPGPALQALCPQNQPGGLGAANPDQRPLPRSYLWNRGTWEWQNVPPQFVPDSTPFTPANNSRAMKFAIKAITAQPFAYAGVVLKETAKPFAGVNPLRFPLGHGPTVQYLAPDNVRYAYAAADGYSRSRGAVAQIALHQYGAVTHAPYAYGMNVYQSVIFLPGPVLGILLLVGLAGLLIPRRRSMAGLLLWLSAVIIIVLPTAEHEYAYRYDIPAIPLICMAAALAFRKPEREAQPAPEPAARSAPAVSPGHG